MMSTHPLIGPIWYLFVSSSFTDEVLYFDASTGAPQGTFAWGGGLTRPLGLAFRQSDQNLYVVGEHGVYRYRGHSGKFLDVFVSQGSGGLTAPTNLTFDHAGNLLVTDVSPARVLRYDGTSGAPLGTFASGGGLTQPSALVFGPDGNLYVTTEGSSGGGVLRYDGTSGVFRDTFVALSSGGLDIPTGMVFGPDGNLYVSSGGTDEVLQYDHSTGRLLGAFVTDGPGAFLDFLGIDFGPDGNLYVGTGRGKILQYDGTNGTSLGQFNGGPDIATPAFLSKTCVGVADEWH